jgi:5'-nucleotidase
MQILLSNDDGIDAEGLKALYSVAVAFGQLTVVAPKRNQSGMGQALTPHRAIEVKEQEWCGIKAYSVDGTPTDCVQFAKNRMGKDFDLLLSGINSGPNIGRDVLYSGTVGAATEGAIAGIPSIALSQGMHLKESYTATCLYLEKFLSMGRHKNLSSSFVLNINVPPSLGAGEQFTVLDGAHFEANRENRGSFPTDSFSLQQGYVSLTPLLLDRTNMQVLQAFKI